MLLPSALGFSPHPPVSVYGTGPYTAIAAFLGSAFTSFPTLSFGPLPPGFSEGDLPPSKPCGCTGFSSPGSGYLTASPQFCVYGVQESKPVVHRLRFPASP